MTSASESNARDPKTIANLRENYRRENISSGKYATYAQKLRQMGYESLANLFLACSHSEIIHATRHARVALLLGITLETQIAECKAESVSEILEEMLQEERDAMNDYELFLKEAQKEKFSSAMISMSAALRADQTHFEYCQEAAASGDYWKNEDRRFCVCALCGYVHAWTKVICPICGAKPDLFLSFFDRAHFDTESLLFEETSNQRGALLSFNDHTWTFEKVFLTEQIGAVELTETIGDALKNNGWSDQDIYAIILSLTEAVVNANEHGNKGVAGKKVAIECAVTDDFFLCSIEDEGEGFNYKEVPNPCLDENLCVPHGRGLKLISHFMSRVWYNVKGNKIFMIKKC